MYFHRAVRTENRRPPYCENTFSHGAEKSVMLLPIMRGWSINPANSTSVGATSTRETIRSSTRPRGTREP